MEKGAGAFFHVIRLTDYTALLCPIGL